MVNREMKKEEKIQVGKVEGKEGGNGSIRGSGGGRQGEVEDEGELTGD